MNNKIFSFTGKIESTFFSNDSNFYKVLLLVIRETDSDYEDSEIVVTGMIGDISEGEDYTFRGQLITHPKYGEQLTIESYEKVAPASVDGLIKYLSSNKFPGIGKETAKKIIEVYPKNTVDAILASPEKLDGILSLPKKNSFIKHLTENFGMEKVLSQLSTFGITGKIAFQIFNFYKERTMTLLKESPYQLVEDIDGIGFVTADKLAIDQGIAADSSERIRAAIMYLMKTNPLWTGDTYVEFENCLIWTIEILERARPAQISKQKVESLIRQMISEKRLTLIHNKLFEKKLARAEAGIAHEIHRIQKTPPLANFDEKKASQLLSEVEKKLNIHYDEIQRSAIFQALKNPLFILTGGPGTGKTTIIKGLLEVYSEFYHVSLDPYAYKDNIFPIVLAAPTGKASRRMTELTDLPASTLHRALGINTEDKEDDLANQLSGQLLIVDEFSMVDTWLANKLFAAIPPTMKVLLVGDSDQLASVGPGQVLTDLLHDNEIPSIRLDKIYRRSADSTITDLAHQIKMGNFPADFTEKKPDRSFFPANTYQVTVLMEQIANSWLRKGNDSFDFQVLIPMYKSAAGIDAVNTLLQDIFNPSTDKNLEFNFQNFKFRKGDKVLQLVNDAKNNVFNGDIGKIVELIPAKYSESKQDELLINFDTQEITYPRNDWNNIRLAYAISIHKAQGSEFGTVIVPMVSAFSRMLQRNLLYTAITRAKQSLILLGEVEAFKMAVSRKGTNRKTYLLERLLGTAVEEVTLSNSYDTSLNSAEFKADFKEDEPNILTLEIVQEMSVDPLIGMQENDFNIF